MASQNLFPTIGTIADTTDRLPEQPVLETRTVELDDDRPVQEIDSLCMKCGEQVCSIAKGMEYLLTFQDRELPDSS